MLGAVAPPTHYLAGVDDDGRSTVGPTTARPVLGRDDALSVLTIWPSDADARCLLPGRAASVEPLDVGVPFGASRALLSTFLRPYRSGLHRTETLDLSTVVSGSVRFHVETGSILMKTGDSVMVPGVLHEWSVEEDGGALLVVMIGARPAR